MNSFFGKAAGIVVLTWLASYGASARENWEAPHDVMGQKDYSNTMRAAKQGEHHVPCHGVVDCRRKSGGKTYVIDALHNDKPDSKPSSEPSKE